MKIRKFTPEQLAGAAKLILHFYDATYELDQDYQIAINVHDIDFNTYKVILHYVYEYNALNDSGTSVVENWKKETIILDKSHSIDMLKLDMYEALGRIQRNPVIHY